MAEANQWEVDAARQSADDAARNEYNRGMLELGNQELALKRAQQAWKEVIDKAGLTGMFEGQYTMPVQQWAASTFGTWGMPTAGQKTLGAIGQEADIGATQAGLFGTWGAPTQGQQTLAGQQQQWSQGFQQQQYEAQQRQLQQQNAQAYLQMLSQLRGPADWAKYQQVLGSTPNGMRDLAAAAMGQYIPGGGATTGVAPQAANLQTMMGQIAGGGYGQANPNNAQQTWQNAAQQQAYPQYQQAQQMAGGAMNLEGRPDYYNPQQGQAAPQGNEQATLQALRGGVTSKQQQAQQQAQQQGYTQGPESLGQQRAGGGTNQFGAPQQNQYQLNAGQQTPQNLPAPNQIAPQAWKNMAPSQQQMLLGQYEAEGWHKPDVEALFAQSLPKYAANAPTSGTLKMR